MIENLFILGIVPKIAGNRKVIMGIVILLINYGISSLAAQAINGSFESKFKRYQKNEMFSGTTTHNWAPVAWQGERIHTQIVLWSDTDIKGLSYTISDFSNSTETLTDISTKLRFGQYIKGDIEARSCAEYPSHINSVEIMDALSNQVATTLKAIDPLKIWLTIDVPYTDITGTYTATFTVNGGDAPLVFNIALTLLDYRLPKVTDWEFHLDLWQFPMTILEHYNKANPDKTIKTWSDAHFELLKPAYNILADTGQKVITTYIKNGALGAESMVKWTRKTDGTWAYDFTVFDKYVTTLMSWGITKQISCFSPVGWNETTIPFWDEATRTTIDLNAPLGSETYETRWGDFLTAFKMHLDSKGWFHKTVLYLDEVSEEKLSHVVAVVHGNHADWKLGIAYSHRLPDSVKANFYDVSGILEDASSMGITNNKIATFYTSCTQKKPNNYVTPENNLAEMTWMSWHAQNEGYNGYLRWAYDFWRLTDPFDARDGNNTAGDFSMIYRSSNNTPIDFLPSLRLIMLREGIQDYEKLKRIKTILKKTSEPRHIETLKELDSIVGKFVKTSGADAEKLVREGQKTLESIAQKIAPY
ncbi:DUF4091 domain-containing protein [Flavivirga amylovorans]|uniref:DUF4091 domain-containing protein n=1 Tax=Flavivirga amylovorans TaxID=870486 RepID=A0ABT8WYL3_9FLAO|nr:glycoside hydrolase domain-containing protein [Flavivirga amylovorans]MDO5986765.1 DUF4091 domain-containing protein [Flavivirga amylovorans]